MQVLRTTVHRPQMYCLRLCSYQKALNLDSHHTSFILGFPGPTPGLSSAALMREAAARSQLQDGVLQLDLLCERAGVHEGLNASADSFFSSQGRPDPNFDDRNSNVIDQLLAMHPHASSLEMETFHLLHLSSCSRGRSCPSSPATAIPCI
jgi:uridine phosphorylase